MEQVNENKVATSAIDKIKYLGKFLKNYNLDYHNILGVNIKVESNIIKNNKIPFSVLFRVQKFFIKFPLSVLKNNKIVIEDELSFDKIKIRQDFLKIRTLDDYLNDKYNVRLYQVIDYPEKSIDNVIKGIDVPSNSIISKTSFFFFLNKQYLTNDLVNLPSLDELKVDEDLISVHRKDLENEILRNKSKHFITRNFSVLSGGKRFKLIMSLILMSLIFVCYTGYASYVIIKDREETLVEYQDNDNIDPPEETYSSNCVDVNVGVQIVKISSIDYSTNTFNVSMRIWFDFDIIDYYIMMSNKNGITSNSMVRQVIDNNPGNVGDYLSYQETTGTFIEGQDFIPDVIQVNEAEYIYNNSYYWGDPSIFTPSETFYKYVEPYYPGYTSSNNYPDLNTMFIIGNGSINADSFSYDERIDYSYRDVNECNNYRCFQKMSFDATIYQTFDSPRYPLDSVDFHILIQPKMLNLNNVRYVPATETYLSSFKLLEKGIAPFDSYVNVNEEDQYSGFVNGVNPLTGGYKLIEETDGLKNFVIRSKYYKTNDNVLTYSSEIEVIVRATRQGFNTFLKAFLNLFSVVIWIFIAFYSQSHMDDDAIGMLGTGLFAAISSILVGLSMVSDAGLISLTTIINVYTLAVIIFMTWNCIGSRNAKIRKSKEDIAYFGIKLRIQFVILLITTIIIFVGLPLASYII